MMSAERLLMCDYEARLRELNAEWHVESGLVSACIPQPDGSEVRLSVERLDDGGWDWVVWRVDARGAAAPAGIYSGAAPHRCDALQAVRTLIDRMRLAPSQLPPGTDVMDRMALPVSRVA